MRLLVEGRRHARIERGRARRPTAPFDSLEAGWVYSTSLPTRQVARLGDISWA